MLLLIYLTPMWAWGYEIQCILRATLMCILRATLMELLIRKYCKFDTFKIKIYATSLPKLYRLNVFFFSLHRQDWVANPNVSLWKFQYDIPKLI